LLAETMDRKITIVFSLDMSFCSIAILIIIEPSVALSKIEV
jgi:hypothetical protein